MSAVLGAVGSVFSWLFVGVTGANPVAPAITTLVSVITGNDYLLIGVSLMIVGSVIGFLARIIHST